MKQFRILFLLTMPAVVLTGFEKYYYNSKCALVAPAVSIGNTSIVEGNSGQRSIEVMVIISPAPTSTISVAYTTRNKTASASSDYIPTNGTISFAPGDIMKRVIVTVVGDTLCESDETFEIVLTNPSGATLKDSIGTVTIVNDDCIGGTTTGGSTSGTNLTTYEVRLTQTGYTSLYGTPTDCPIRRNGKVVLSGLVSGAEHVDPDDDINYTGVLQLDIDMDICSVKRLPGGEDKFCGIRVLGCGEMKTELEIQADQRGGYVKFNEESPEFIKMAVGDCDNQQLMEEQDMIPNKTIAAIFNGYELPMLTNRTLRVGRYVVTGDGIETVVEVLRVIQR